jgi:hypothetical protein
MDDLLMPSDVKKASAANKASASAASNSAELPPPPMSEPPSVKLIVRLFLIPLLIVSAAVGVMWLIGRMAGGTPTVDEAIARLKQPGGQRTGDFLLGPGSKQRYMDAKTLVDQMKAGLPEAERVKLSGQLIDLIEHYTKPEEGEVQHFLLLALGRCWQKSPGAAEESSTEATAARSAAMDTLLKFADDPLISTRKAAILAMVYFAGQPDASRAVPVIISKLRDPREDLDVRIAAATALGPIGSPSDSQIIDALHAGLSDTDRHDVELVWSSALSLAELNQPDVADTILKLLDRNELSQAEYFDRESDPQNPSFRKLSDQEQQRILINTMIGAHKLQVPAVQDRLKQIADSDPSPRVRAAGREILAGKPGNAGEQ